MDLNHRLLVFLVIIGSNRPRRTNHLHNFIELIHLGPVRSIEPIRITEIYIRTVSEEQFDNLLETEPSSVVESRELAFVSQRGVASIVQQQTSNLEVILLHRVVQRRLLPNIIILLQIHIRSVFDKQLNKVDVLDHHGNVQGRRTVYISRVYLGLLVLEETDSVYCVTVGDRVEEQVVAWVLG